MASAIHDIREMLGAVRTGHSLNLNRISEAIELADHLYGNESHWTGQTTLQHAAGVLQHLLPFEPDEDTIISCILHDVLEVGGMSLSELEEQFGSDVRSLVGGMHLLSHVTARGRRSSIEDLRLMLVTVSDDVRTVLMILCDRLQLLDCIDSLPSEERRPLCQDVLALFAPVAARLGIYSLKHQLEAKTFPVLYPDDAERIAEQILTIEEKYGEFLRGTVQDIQKYLEQQEVDARVLSRRKQPYSLFVKMKEKSLTHINDVYDFYAIRVIVGSVEDCYRTLGALHSLGRPLGNRFKDYISFPKPNGYQSLHTTILQLPHVPDDVMVEIQVRTEGMHRESEYGIAAHWSYKEQGSASKAFENMHFQQALSSQESLQSESGTQLMDHIFVLTPDGDIIELPEGATPLDFAFKVHTELGLSFRGARVNGEMVPITHQLENGDVVEVQRHKHPRPSSQWLQLLTLSSARAKLKRYLYEQERPQYIMHGRSLLNRELTKRQLPTLDSDLKLLRKYEGEVISYHQREDLLLKIGQDAEKASSLLHRLDALEGKIPSLEQEKEVTHSVSSKITSSNVVLDIPMPTRFAKCCKPDTGKRGRIVGIASRAGVVTIHRHGCGMLRNANPARRVRATWEEL